MRLTGWFPGEVKPVRVGVYQRRFAPYDVGYSLWDGYRWRRFYSLYDCHHAFLRARAEVEPSLVQYLEWRVFVEMKWHSGPPPSVGWWPASFDRCSSILRWWDGELWSSFASSVDSAEKAARYAKEKMTRDQCSRIEWTARWWEK